MAAIDDVARGFTAMLRRGEFEAAGARYGAETVTSIAPQTSASGEVGHPRDTERIDEIGIDGPFITGDQFALFLDMLIIDAASGHTRPFTEIGIFTVRDGRIVEERFFYD